MHPTLSRALAAALAALVAILVATAPAGAAVRSVAPSSPLAKAGSRLELTVRGSGQAVLLLSTDKRRNRGDVSLGSKNFKKKRTKLKLRIPRRTPQGGYYVLACSQPKPGKRARCKRSKKRMAVTARPRPAKVSPTADSARTVTMRVGREGGTVAATGADGTTYTLELPAGALLDPTDVTMTPLSAVGGLPMRARDAKAVQIGPEGRGLLKAATLEIAGPGLPSAATLTGFGFEAAGGQFHLTPASTDGTTVTVPVYALESTGVASASARARYDFSRSRLPTSLVHQLQQVASIPSAPRRGRAGAAQAPSSEVGLQAFALFVHIQALAMAGQIDDAVIQFVPWDAISLGLTSMVPEVPVWRTQLTLAFRNGIQRQVADARGACLGNDIRQMGRLLRYRDYLFTTLAALALQDMRTEIDDALSRCLRFELVYDVTISGANSYGEAVNAQVNSTIPIRMQVPGDTSFFSGEAPLTVAAYSTGPVDCYTHTWVVTPSAPFIVRRMSVGIARERGAEAIPPEVRLAFNLGALDEQVTHTCEGESYTDQQHAYDGVAAALLGGESGSDFELSWAGGGASGGDYASQTFQRSAESDGSYTGSFTFRLRHTPG